MSITCLCLPIYVCVVVCVYIDFNVNAHLNISVSVSVGVMVVSIKFTHEAEIDVNIVVTWSLGKGNKAKPSHWQDGTLPSQAHSAEAKRVLRLNHRHDGAPGDRSSRRSNLVPRRNDRCTLSHHRSANPAQRSHHNVNLGFSA